MRSLLIVLAATVLLLFNACVQGNKPAGNALRHNGAKLPVLEKTNDKIIVVDNADLPNMKKALSGFCDIYNKNDYTALPRLWQLTSDSFAVTFPYDVDFATFCFAVNFLKYPINIKWHAQVRAWATTKPGDDWITYKSMNKQVMLYLAIDDMEYDNVFLTTSDNIGYKLGFAVGKEKQLLTAPKEKFIAPTVAISSLNSDDYIDFR
jgi:hypothetical protein